MRSNSLIVFANDRDMAKIDEIVKEVDSILAQVLIEAIIVNVNLSDGMDTGINILMNESVENPIITGSKMGPSMVANTPAPTNPTVQPGQEVMAVMHRLLLRLQECGRNTHFWYAIWWVSYLSRYEDGLDFAMSAVANSSSAD